MTKLQTADFHCDVLYKLLEDNNLSFLKDTQGKLDVTLPRLKQAGAVFQTFAIYTPEQMEKTMIPILQSIDLFHRKVLSVPEMKWIRTKGDVKKIGSDNTIGAMLSLEGAEGLQGDLAMLRILYQLGVRAAGLTWNYANWGADGAKQVKHGGLTAKGRAFLKECNKMGILLDVSHLSERSFWDMIEETTKPIIASHSNSRAICDHPRNLTDEQIKALIDVDGLIGITFVPHFLQANGSAAIDDVLKHIEHICELDGGDRLMFGSDFDGIDSHVIGLAHPGELSNLQEELLKRYSERQVKAFFADNAIGFLTKYLPD